jgi:hypothetical protein
MAGLHRLPTSVIRWINLWVCFAFALTAITGVPFQAVSGKASIRLQQQGNGQGNGRERRVSRPAPRRGSPAENLPNLSEVQHRRLESPQTPITRLPWISFNESSRSQSDAASATGEKHGMKSNFSI